MNWIQIVDLGHRSPVRRRAAGRGRRGEGSVGDRAGEAGSESDHPILRDALRGRRARDSRSGCPRRSVSWNCEPSIACQVSSDALPMLQPPTSPSTKSDQRFVTSAPMRAPTIGSTQSTVFWTERSVRCARRRAAGGRPCARARSGRMPGSSAGAPFTVSEAGFTSRFVLLVTFQYRAPANRSTSRRRRSSGCSVRPISFATGNESGAHAELGVERPRREARVDVGLASGEVSRDVAARPGERNGARASADVAHDLHPERVDDDERPLPASPRRCP